MTITVFPGFSFDIFYIDQMLIVTNENFITIKLSDLSIIVENVLETLTFLFARYFQLEATMTNIKRPMIYFHLMYRIVRILTLLIY